jgi:hypothetical protein
LLRQGQNPYDVRALLQLEQAHGWPWPTPAHIWTPPWALVLLYPLSLLPFGSAHVVWFMLQLVLILGSSFLLWRYFVPQDSLYRIAPVVAMWFFPALSSLLMGQWGAWLLVGVVGFVSAVRSRRDLMAGGALSLLTIKPHVTYLFWPAALWWACRERRWRVLAGWGAALIAASGIASLLSPQVFANFVASVMEPPLDWPTPPTIGTLLRLLFGWERSWLPFLPSVLGALGLVTWLYRRQGRWHWERAANPLLLASVITAPYGWSHDQLVLLPAVVAVVGWILPIHGVGRVAVVVAWLASQLGCFVLTQQGAGDFALVWHAPVLAGLYVWGGSLRMKHTPALHGGNSDQASGTHLQ